MSLFDSVFIIASKNYVRIVRLFQLFHLFVFAVSLFVSYSVYTRNDFFPEAYSLAVTAGKSALIFLILASIPGIARRFGIKHKIFVLLSMFRRHLGIATYMFVFMHVSTMFYIPLLAGLKPNQLLSTAFQLAGFGANVLLFVMFLTSNDFSTKRLGIWWKRIHSVVYVVIWLVFIHTYLQRISIWSVIIGIAALSQVASFAYQRYMKKKAFSAVHSS